MSDLLFLPQPASVVTNDGEFRLAPNMPIVLTALSNDGDLFTAACLQEALEEYAGISLPLEKRYRNDHPGPAIVLLRADRDLEWLPMPEVPPELHPQGYHLRIHPGGIALTGADAAGMFYGVQTLVQILDQAGRQLPCLEITDHPSLPVRGVMLDCSRGKVPTVEAVLELVHYLAQWKINQLQLYVEHTFAWPSHPKIGQGHGPFTADDFIRIDAACAERHIELVPNLQSFGHQGHLLRLRKYSHLAESPKKWTLSPAEPGTYELLDELYAEYLPNFRSPLFNVDSDETWDLGKGKSAPLVAERGLGRVYLEHILKLRDLAEKYGRQIMFWGDIILHYPELIDEVPDDVIVLQWEYGRNPKEEAVRKFAEAGKRFYVCPGTNSWSAFFPRQREARANIGTMARYGVQYGASGLLNTDWGDGGHYNMLGLSYYAYAFGAAESWNAGGNPRFDNAFGRLFFGVGWEAVLGAMRHLERVAEPVEGVYITDAAYFHMGFLTGTPYRERLTPEIVHVMRENARLAMDLLKKVADRTRQPLVVSELSLGALQDWLLAEKATLAVDFHRQYAELRAHPDPARLAELARTLRPALHRLAKATLAASEVFADLWLARAHEAGLALVQEWQHEVAADLEAAATWIAGAAQQAARQGEVLELPPASDAWKPKFWEVQMGC